MTIPDEWLYGPTSPAEVEEELAEFGAPDLWLRQWRSLLMRFVLGDELWEYHSVVWGPDCGETECHYGFALLHEGEVLDWIKAPGEIW